MTINLHVPAVMHKADKAFLDRVFGSEIPWEASSMYGQTLKAVHFEGTDSNTVSVAVDILVRSVVEGGCPRAMGWRLSKADNGRTSISLHAVGI